MKLFRKNTQADITNSTAAFLPGGRAFDAKNRDGSSFRDFLNGISRELFRLDEQMNIISEDYDINLTTQLIERWESAVGIPDDCFLGNGTLVERRRDVLAKLAKMNVTTEQDFIDLAALFGINVTITAGADTFVFPLTFPISLVATAFPLPFPYSFPTGIVTSAKAARFTMIVEFPGESEVFPLAFPIAFGFPLINTIRCLFDKLKPANVNIIYV